MTPYYHRGQRVIPDGGETKTVTFKVDEGLVDDLDEEAEARDVSRSEYLRDIIESRHEAEELQNRVDELRRQLQSANQRIDAANELVEYVEEEREVRVRERRIEEAPVWRRAKWWVTGAPSVDENRPD